MSSSSTLAPGLKQRHVTILSIAGAIGALETMKKEFPGEEKNINGHIERLKAQLPKENP